MTDFHLYVINTPLARESLHPVVGALRTTRAMFEMRSTAFETHVERERFQAWLEQDRDWALLLGLISSFL